MHFQFTLHSMNINPSPTVLITGLLLAVLASPAMGQLVPTSTEMTVVENAPASDDYYQFLIASKPLAPIDIAVSFDASRLSLSAYQALRTYPDATSFQIDPNTFGEDPLNPGFADISDPNNFITIVVTPIDNQIACEPNEVTIVHTLTSADPAYDGDVLNISVKIEQDEYDPNHDCNQNGIPDECEVDCNLNGIPDDCDIDPNDPDGDGWISADCNENGIPDECEDDCNKNGVVDLCDLDPSDPDGDGLVSTDCNQNGIPDECDIDPTDPDANGSVSGDCDGNGQPDECEFVATESGKLLAADGAADDEMGASVAISGSLALVGAPYSDGSGNASGAVYAYQNVGGVWQQIDKLTAADTTAGDQFGFDVAMDGQCAVIGARGNEGAAYVFEFINGAWQEVSKLTAADSAASDRFGASVSISGLTILIGAPRDDDFGRNTGSAYVFQNVGGDWFQLTKLYAADPTRDDYFGFSVAISGSYAAVSRPGKDNSNGKAYIFERINGTWRLVKQINGGENSTNVALNGTTLAVSYLNWYSEGHFDPIYFTGSGSVRVIERIDGEWQQTKFLTGSDTTIYDQYGINVAISANTILVGAQHHYSTWLYDDTGGAVYAYTRQGTNWIEDAKYQASDHAQRDYFGQCVAISGETVLIGAPENDDHGPDSGSAYLFEPVLADCNGNGIADACDIDPNGVSSDCNANGIPDECEPDCNGNGVPDDCDIDPNDPDADGFVAVDVNDNGIPDNCEVDCNNNGVLDQFDIDPNDPDGDGFVSSDDNNNGNPDECDPDCNGNGVDDLLDVAPDDPDGDGFVSNDCNGNLIPDECETDCNGNGIFDACDTTATEAGKIIASDGVTEDVFGNSMDIEGRTLVIGAPGTDDNGNQSGAAYVYVYAAEQWNEVAKLVASDAGANKRFGSSVAIHSGRIVVGSDNDADLGSVYLFEKIGGQWQQVEKLTTSDSTSGALFGHSVALDQNMLLVGAPGDKAAYIFENMGGIWQETARLESHHFLFGIQVAMENGVAVVLHTSVLFGEYYGRAFVFERIAGEWEQVAQSAINSPGFPGWSDLGGSYYCTSVDISDGQIIFGAVIEVSEELSGGIIVDLLSAPIQVFEKVNDTWQCTATLFIDRIDKDARFGHIAAIDGDTIVVNAVSERATYVFKRYGESWNLTNQIKPDDTFSDSRYGYAAAVSGDVAVIGASHDNDLGTDSGSVYFMAPQWSDWNQNMIPDACEFDCNGDLLITFEEFPQLQDCLQGPGNGLGTNCECLDFDQDGSISMFEAMLYQVMFTDI